VQKSLLALELGRGDTDQVQERESFGHPKSETDRIVSKAPAERSEDD
jgi:hypothetical protein